MPGHAGLSGNHLGLWKRGERAAQRQSLVWCGQGGWAEPQTQIFGAGSVPEPESCWQRLLGCCGELLTSPAMSPQCFPGSQGHLVLSPGQKFAGLRKCWTERNAGLKML